ncbi:MAG: LysR family transcriptional regulator, partial [Solibacillus sp.]
MEIKWLKTFITTVETGNFRIAAEKLFISQPSITVHIKQLEESLNVQLFERHHTQIKLTSAGRFYYPLALNIIKNIDESRRAVQLLSQQNKIQLAVALSPLLAETNLPQIIYQFSIDYPQYEIDIIVEDSKYMDELILTNKVQLAICIGKSKMKKVHSEKISSSPLKLIYPLQSSEKNTRYYKKLQELVEKYPLFTGHLEETMEVETLLEKDYPQLRKRTIKQSHIIKQFVKDGLGMAFLPESIIDQDLEDYLFTSFDFTFFYIPTVDLY